MGNLMRCTACTWECLGRITAEEIQAAVFQVEPQLLQVEAV